MCHYVGKNQRLASRLPAYTPVPCVQTLSTAPRETDLASAFSTYCKRVDIVLSYGTDYYTRLICIYRLSARRVGQSRVRFTSSTKKAFTAVYINAGGLVDFYVRPRFSKRRVKYLRRARQAKSTTVNWDLLRDSRSEIENNATHLLWSRDASTRRCSSIIRYILSTMTGNKNGLYLNKYLNIVGRLKISIVYAHL